MDVKMVLALTRLFRLCVELNVVSEYAVFVDFSGHVDVLEVRIKSSKGEDFKHVYRADIRLFVDPQYAKYSPVPLDEVNIAISVIERLIDMEMGDSRNV